MTVGPEMLVEDLQSKYGQRERLFLHPDAKDRSAFRY